MSSHCWWVARVIVLLAVASSVACDAAIERAVRAQLEAGPSIPIDDDALNVVLCGTGSPLPDADHAGPCTAVIAGGEFYLFDIGPGSWENLQLWNLPVNAVSGIALTHFHSDHIGGLGEALTQSWIASGRAEPLPVFGPKGVGEVVAGFNEAYAQDRLYRELHHSKELMPASGGGGLAQPFVVPAPGASVVIVDRGDLRISAFAVDHEPVSPAVGYRIDYKDRSVVISGDTQPSKSLITAARGSDILVHEALNGEMMELLSGIMADLGRKRTSKLALDVLDYHTSPSQAKAIADEAGVPLLVLTHNVPPMRNALIERRFLAGLDMDGVVLGDDGMRFRLPVGSKAVEETSF